MWKFIKTFLSGNKNYIILILLLFISLSVLPLNDGAKLVNLKRYAFTSFAVITSAIDEISDWFRNDSEMLKLKKINAELMLENNLLREYALESKKLKAMLDFKDTTQYDLQAASVISKIVSPIQGNLIINTGQNDSVMIGMPVLNEKGLVGLITHTSSEFSIVRIIQNIEFKLNVEVQRTKYNGILKWNGRELSIINIPTSADIRIGDRVVSSDFSTLIPVSIPIGLVKGKESTVSGLLGRVFVEPFVDFASLKNVFVLKIVKSFELERNELNFYNKN